MQESGIELEIFSKSHRTLSQNIPILSSFGFEIDSEVSYQIQFQGEDIYSQKYLIACKDHRLFQHSSKHTLEALLLALARKIPDDTLNSLSYLENLSAMQIELLRALASYANQLVSAFNKTLIFDTLVKHHKITKLFFSLFTVLFSPKVKKRDEKKKGLIENIVTLLKEVKNINEDKVLNIFLSVINALTRTNYYDLEGHCLDARALGLKIDVLALCEYIKGIQPRIETFVYHPLLQGVHMRRSLISRGGLRWSDRYEDFRNEVRHLMQAQRQKNSIIIPNGAKGGFVIFAPAVDRALFTRAYTLYIEALLDLVDNIDTPKNPNIICYDTEDSYFVVAADKGTASMSDVANAISSSRGFWLKDAFASGGSKGYSHKAMGITAKGAIKSSERFFIETGKNFYEEEISVIGIGSPAGDVFGNGMLLSEKFKLVGAISSKEIFLDPNPNTQAAYQERKRLFELGGGWDKYDQNLISKGGGVFHKESKEILVSEEVKKLLALKKNVVNGEELTRALLCAKVDMLFSGGVGTYVKGSEESDSEIGDKPNEAVRVNAKDIKAYCVCEGGNLSFTQKSRIEYAKRGGRISADSIDNSAGVQTSDYEVNIKILLASLEAKGIIEEETRYEILHSLIPDIEQIVLWTNYFQSLALSLDEVRSIERLEEIKRSITVLEENLQGFERALFELPNGEDFGKAVGKNGKVLRPILAVLLSFAKIFTKSYLLRHTEFLDSEFALEYLYKYFPKKLVALYHQEIEQHKLKREIIATYIADKVINAMGCTFIADFDPKNDTFLLKIKAFLVTNELISANDLRHQIFRLDYKLGTKKQYEILLKNEENIRFLSAWLLEHGEYKISLFDHIAEYKKSFHEFLYSIDLKGINLFYEEDELLSRYYYLNDTVKMALTIIDVKESTNESFLSVATLFYNILKDLDTSYLLSLSETLAASNEWEMRYKALLQKEIFGQIYAIVHNIVRFKRKNENIQDAYNAYLELNKEVFAGYFKDINALKSLQTISPINISVALSSFKKIASIP